MINFVNIVFHEFTPVIIISFFIKIILILLVFKEEGGEKMFLKNWERDLNIAASN